MRIVVLVSDVQDIGADDLGHLAQYLGQAIGAVGLIDIADVYSRSWSGVAA